MSWRRFLCFLAGIAFGISLPIAYQLFNGRLLQPIEPPKWFEPLTCTGAEPIPGDGTRYFLKSNLQTDYRIMAQSQIALFKSTPRGLVPSGATITTPVLFPSLETSSVVVQGEGNGALIAFDTTNRYRIALCGKEGRP